MKAADRATHPKYPPSGRERMTESLNWDDGLDEHIAYLAEHDPNGLNIALTHLFSATAAGP
jgi:hypothetical protein